MIRLHPTTRTFATVFVLAGSALHAAAGDGAAVDPRAEASLIAATTAAVRGGTTTVGVRFTLGPGTHLYWRNPGDAGMAPSLKWTLPEGVTAGSPAWPAPRRFESGGIVGFGYDAEFLLPVEIRVPTDFKGETLPLRVEASWLACTEICVPGEAALSLDLPLRDGDAAIDARWMDSFERSRASLPLKPPGDALAARVEGEFVLLVVRGLPAGSGAPWFFPEDERTVVMDGAQTVIEDAPAADAAAKNKGDEAATRSLTMRLPLFERYDGPPKRLQGVLAWDAAEGRRGWVVDVPLEVEEASAEDGPPGGK